MKDKEECTFQTFDKVTVMYGEMSGREKDKGVVLTCLYMMQLCLV